MAKAQRVRMLTLSVELYHLGLFELFFLPLLRPFLSRLMWTSVNTGMFSQKSLGGVEENNSVDSKEPEGRGERTPQE